MLILTAGQRSCIDLSDSAQHDVFLLSLDIGTIALLSCLVNALRAFVILFQHHCNIFEIIAEL